MSPRKKPKKKTFLTPSARKRALKKFNAADTREEQDAVLKEFDISRSAVLRWKKQGLPGKEKSPKRRERRLRIPTTNVELEGVFSVVDLLDQELINADNAKKLIAAILGVTDK